MANATMSKDEILEAIGNMSVFELAELIEAFKSKFNVTISAAAPAAPAGGGAGAAPAAAPAPRAAGAPAGAPAAGAAAGGAAAGAAVGRRREADAARVCVAAARAARRGRDLRLRVGFSLGFSLRGWAPEA